MEKIIISDRYSATGTPYPTEDSCDWCEGMGISPTYKNSLNQEARKTAHGKLIIVGQQESDGSPMEEDDWVFVRCPECFGTRKKNPTREQILERLEADFLPKVDSLRIKKD